MVVWIASGTRNRASLRDARQKKHLGDHRLPRVENPGLLSDVPSGREFHSKLTPMPQTPLQKLLKILVLPPSSTRTAEKPHILEFLERGSGVPRLAGFTQRSFPRSYMFETAQVSFNSALCRRFHHLRRHTTRRIGTPPLRSRGAPSTLRSPV